MISQAETAKNDFRERVATPHGAATLFVFGIAAPRIKTMTRKEFHRKLYEAAGDIIGAETLDEKQARVRAAIQATLPKDTWFFVESWTADQVVYALDEGDLLSRKFEESNGEVTLGEAVRVRRVFEALESNSDSIEIEGDFVALVEAASDGSTAKIKVIEPGQGSNGYYPSDVLRRDIPALAVDGMKMFWNHPTVRESKERPERDLRDVAAVLKGNAYWDTDGPSGPGVYAEAKVFSEYRDAIKELGSHVGVSIRGGGKVADKTIDGHKRKVVESIDQLASIDFVTEPGAGGRVVELFESASHSNQPLPRKEETSMDDKTAAQLTESVGGIVATLKSVQESLADQGGELKRLREAGLRTDATLAATRFAESKKLPKSIQENIIKESVAAIPLTENGEIDLAKLEESVSERIETALDIAKAFGSKAPKVDNGGEFISEADSSRGDLEKEFVQLQEKALGVPVGQPN